MEAKVETKVETKEMRELTKEETLIIDGGKQALIRFINGKMVIVYEEYCCEP